MRKNLFYKLGALLCIAFLVASCSSTQATSSASAKAVPADAPSVSGQFTVISKYGNMDTTITDEAMAAAGFELGDVCVVQVKDVVYEAPYVNSYGDVGTHNRLFHPHHGVTEFAICNGNYANEYGFEVGDTVTITLKEKGGYLEDLEIRKIQKSENRNDYISDSQFANVRAVQLGEIGFNKLYRSCNPILDDARGPYAAKLLADRGINTVLNLSNAQKDLLPMASVAPNAGWYKDLVQKGNVIGADMAMDFFRPEFLEQQKQVLLFMLDHEPPYLVHCNEGRDRAGYFSALFAGLMGASVDEIWADYMASFDNYFGIKEDTRKYDFYLQYEKDFLNRVNGGQDVTNANVADAVKNFFINSVGLTEAQVEGIKAKLR